MTDDGRRRGCHKEGTVRSEELLSPRIATLQRRLGVGEPDSLEAFWRRSPRKARP